MPILSEINDSKNNTKEFKIQQQENNGGLFLMTIKITVTKSLVDKLVMKHLFNKSGSWLKINEDWYDVKIEIEESK
jgi:hypothetical protein